MGKLAGGSARIQGNPFSFPDMGKSGACNLSFLSLMFRAPFGQAGIALHSVHAECAAVYPFQRALFFQIFQIPPDGFQRNLKKSGQLCDRDGGAAA